MLEQKKSKHILVHICYQRMLNTNIEKKPLIKQVQADHRI